MGFFIDTLIQFSYTPNTSSLEKKVFVAHIAVRNGEKIFFYKYSFDELAKSRHSGENRSPWPS